MNKLRLLGILLLGLSLSMATSCKKDDDTNDDNGDGGNSPGAKTCLLKKSTYDDGTYETYDFDSHDRIVKLTEFDNSGSKDTELKFLYDNNGLFMEFNIIDAGDSAMKVQMFYHTGSSKPDSAKVFMNGGNALAHVSTINYTFSGDQLVKTETKADPFNTGTKTIVSKNEYTYSGKNVTRVTQYILNASTGNMDLSATIEYTYDDKINPYKGIGVDYFMGEVQFLSENNYLKMTYMDAQGTVNQKESYNYTYEYNANSYPVKITEKDFANTKSNTTVMEYNCK